MHLLEEAKNGLKPDRIREERKGIIREETGGIGAMPSESSLQGAGGGRGLLGWNGRLHSGAVSKGVASGRAEKQQRAWVDPCFPGEVYFALCQR